MEAKIRKSKLLHILSEKERTVIIMCAIAGVFGPILDAEARRKIMDTMKRRGPDGSGEYVRDNIVIMNTRLAIIDPIGGAQPMAYFHGNENYVITYNGEIYNTDEVRRELEMLAAEAGITPAELFVRYLFSFAEADGILTGVDNAAQLKYNAALAEKGPLPEGLFRQITGIVPELPERLIRPSLWNKC
jgi:glutamate synthase domain-containing protein 1